MKRLLWILGWIQLLNLTCEAAVLYPGNGSGGGGGGNSGVTNNDGSRLNYWQTNVNKQFGANGGISNIVAPVSVVGPSNSVGLVVSNTAFINGIQIGTNYAGGGGEGAGLVFDSRYFADRGELSGGNMGFWFNTNAVNWGQIVGTFNHSGSPGNFELGILSYGGVHIKGGINTSAGQLGYITLGDQTGPLTEVAIERSGGDGNSGLFDFDTSLNSQSLTAIPGPGMRAITNGGTLGWAWLSIYNPSPNYAGAADWSHAGGIEQMQIGTNYVAVDSLTANRLVATDGGTPPHLISTNVTSFLNGTSPHIARFTSATTVGDSVCAEDATNQWSWKSLPSTAYTNSMTNLWFYEIGGGPTTNAAIELSQDSGTGYLRLLQRYGSGIVPANHNRAGIKFNEAWLINGYGSSSTGDGGGKVPDWLPLIDDAFSIGSSSLKVKGVTTGVGGYGASGNATSPQFSTSTGYGWGSDSTGLYMYTTDHSTKAAKFVTLTGPSGTGFQWDMGLGGIAGGGSVGSPAAWFVGQASGLWMTGTNVNVAALPPATGIIGSIATGTDHSGGDLILSGGTSTGTGTNGAVRIRTAESSTTGSSVNVAYDRIHVAGKTVTLTTNSATLVFNVTLPTALKTLGGMVIAHTETTDGTDVAAKDEEFVFTAIRKSTTVTTAIGASANSSTVSSGSLAIGSTTWTAVANAQSVDIKCNLVTTGGLGTSTTARYQFIQNSSAVPVITEQ